MTARRTHTLGEVADTYLPPEWTDGSRWLSRRLNRGELKGIRTGRTWLMPDSDVDYMLDKLSNEDRVAEPEPEPEAPEPTTISFSEALSPRSRARLRKVGR